MSLSPLLLQYYGILYNDNENDEFIKRILHIDILSNSQFLRDNFVGAPNLGIFWKHGQTTTPAAMSPTLEVHRFFLTSLTAIKETEEASVCRPNSISLGCLTIRRCHGKGSVFSSIVIDLFRANCSCYFFLTSLEMTVASLEALTGAFSGSIFQLAKRDKG